MVVEKVQLTIITRMSDDPIYTHQGRRNVWGHGVPRPPPNKNQRGTDYPPVDLHWFFEISIRTEKKIQLELKKKFS